ncbi:Kv channel-interacting protein 2 isoform X4 [Falco naumanni]|uniref:Kv channel-interacting protein 2 isoform X4 n=1 Tax=Falco naumanni TaxID=148594 RepID=UPI001ADE9577|nr:Kv channel-interacting protein 2 isoform X4 [Falco naumanni]
MQQLPWTGQGRGPPSPVAPGGPRAQPGVGSVVQGLGDLRSPAAGRRLRSPRPVPSPSPSPPPSPRGPRPPGLSQTAGDPTRGSPSRLPPCPFPGAPAPPCLSFPAAARRRAAGPGRRLPGGGGEGRKGGGGRAQPRRRRRRGTGRLRARAAVPSRAEPSRAPGTAGPFLLPRRAPRAAGRGEAAGAGPPCPAAEPVRPVAVPPAARRGGKMRSKGRKESLSDSRDLDGSYDQLTV